jgi:hypothetical protein
MQDDELAFSPFALQIGSSPGFEDGEFESAKFLHPASSFYHAAEDCLFIVDSEVLSSVDCLFLFFLTSSSQHKYTFSLVRCFLHFILEQ